MTDEALAQLRALREMGAIEVQLAADGAVTLVRFAAPGLSAVPTKSFPEDQPGRPKRRKHPAERVDLEAFYTKQAAS